MRNIQPIQIWQNGQFIEVSLLNVKIVYDDLDTSCKFYYQLKNNNQNNLLSQKIVDGNVDLSGQDYLEWNGSNEDAYSYVAQQLNLTIV